MKNLKNSLCRTHVWILASCTQLQNTGLLLMQMKSERMEAAASEFILHSAKHAALYFPISHLVLKVEVGSERSEKQSTTALGLESYFCVPFQHLNQIKLGKYFPTFKNQIKFISSFLWTGLVYCR